MARDSVWDYPIQVNLDPWGISCHQSTSRQARRKKLNGRANRHSCVARRCFGRFAALGLGLLAILVAGLLFVLATTAYALSFGDVGASHPYVTAISDLASRGLINGFPDGTFRPDAPVEREQFAKMIVKTLGLPVSAADADPFTDVPRNLDPADPFYPDKYVAVCYEKGLTDAKTPTTFAPFDDLSRAQLITFVARAANLPDPPASYSPPFGNFSAEHYSWARKAAYAGLLDGLQGMGPSFDFFQSASRGECAQVLHNLLLLTQPANTRSTLSPPATLGAAPANANTSNDPGLANGTARRGSLHGVERIFRNPYVITGICVVLLALGAVLIVVRRARSARGQRQDSTGPIAPSATQEDVQTLLREWREKKPLISPWPEMENRNPSSDDALLHARGSADVTLWNELVKLAESRTRPEA